MEGRTPNRNQLPAINGGEVVAFVLLPIYCSAQYNPVNTSEQQRLQVCRFTSVFRLWIVFHFEVYLLVGYTEASFYHFPYNCSYDSFLKAGLVLARD